jgi:hypothetical protein
MAAIGFYIGVTAMFLPFVAMITGLTGVAIGVATPVSALVATVIVTLQLRALDNGYGRGRWWRMMGKAACLPFRVDAEIVGHAARLPVVDRAVMFVGATMAFWWPAVVLAICERLF